MASRRSRLRISVAVALVVLAIGVAFVLRPAPPSPRGVASGTAQPAGPGSPAVPRSSTAPAPGYSLSFPLPPAPGAPGRAAVEGRVLSRETGRGIAGAEVTFSRGGVAAGTRSGDDGAFRFDPPEEGRWHLAAVAADGFLPFAPEWGHSPVVVEARPGATVRGVELRLAPATVLVGTVIDLEGAPVAGAEVRLLGASAEAALVAIRDRFTADAAGEFRFSAPRGAVVEARKPGFAPGRAEVDLVASVERRIVVRLGASTGPPAKAERVGGRVIERGSGAPIAGALVVAQREGRFGVGAVRGQAVSAADGSFVVDELDPGQYQLTASAEGRVRGIGRKVASGTTDVALALDRGARLRGCVRDAASGDAVGAFTVAVLERRSTLSRAPMLARSFLDPSGCWALDDAAPGPAAVIVAAPGFAPSAEVVVEIPEAGEAIADATVLRGGRLRGVVLGADRRTPLAGARVAVESILPEAGSTLPIADEAWTEARGEFVLTGLPRRFSLQVVAPGHHVRVVSGLEVPAGGETGPIVVALTPTAEGEEPRREITGIGVAVAPRDDALVVTSVMAGGGAAEAGLVRGDAIVRVDGSAVTDLGYGGAVDAIRGPEGTTVRLAVRREGAMVDVRVGRGIVRG